ALASPSMISGFICVRLDLEIERRETVYLLGRRQYAHAAHAEVLENLRADAVGPQNGPARGRGEALRGREARRPTAARIGQSVMCHARRCAECAQRLDEISRGLLLPEQH